MVEHSPKILASDERSSHHFEPSQPQRIISGLKTNFDPSRNYSAPTSSNHKVSKINGEKHQQIWPNDAAMGTNLWLMLEYVCTTCGKYMVEPYLSGHGSRWRMPDLKSEASTDIAELHWSGQQTICDGRLRMMLHI